MEADPRRWISALRGSHDRLVEVAGPLTAARLRAQSYCTDWSVAQVLSHLGSGADIALLILRAALEGRDAPDRDASQAIWDVWDARSPEEQRAACLERDGEHIRRLEELEEHTLSRMRVSVYGLDLDGTGLARIRLGEHAVHTWDVAVTFDPDAELDRAASALLVDTIPPLVERVARPLGRAASLRVRTTDPARDLLLRLDGQSRMTPWADGDRADGVLDLPAAELVRLGYGRLDPAHARGASIAAASVTLDDLRRVFPGF